MAHSGVGSRLRLLGAVRAEEVERYYSVLDIVVYPRRPTRLTEMTTPLKPLEAMAMSKAVVASDVGGLQELAADGAALLYRAGNLTAFEEACAELIASPRRRAELGEEARRRICEHRTWTAATRRYAAVYAAAARRSVM